ncbi:amino acid transporter [Thermococcus profundus]|uniref:Amino acid transporter n=1 Tax=Thermococcus profundus TaxID=49899 RepID=A0A2Z2M7V5_THEPR|nr:amino acid permease [Thermococcus profundus]ASJ02337.1 amino acid transporter [Thermococcus profundus]
MEEEVQLSRGLSIWHLMMMGMGMMIGAGVFVATGISIGFAGPGGILVAFALNGLVALFSAMAFAELASAIPTAGGAYTYIDEAFKGLVGFLSGWLNWFALTVAGSLYAITFATYTVFLLEGTDWFSSLGIGSELAIKALALFIIIVFVAINYIGVSETGNIENLITIGQMSTLIFIGLFAVFYTILHPERLSHFTYFVPNGWGKVLAAMGFTYVGFEGYEVIAHAGEEAFDPKESIPKAILYSVVAVTTTYLLFAFAAIVGADVSPENLTAWFASHGAVGMGEAIKDLMPYGGLLITLAAIFSSTSALNATIYSSTRVLFAISRDGRLPKFASRIHPVRRVPHIALALSSIIIITVAMALPIEDVAASADIVFLLIFLLVNAAVIKIRHERGSELEYGFLMPYFPAIPIIAIILQAVLSVWVFNVSPTAWLVTLGWLGLGLVISTKYKGAKEARKTHEREVVFGEWLPEGYKVLAAVSNPKTAPYIAKIGETIAEAKNGELAIVTVVTVPEQTPLEEARRFAGPAFELIREVKASLSGKVNIRGVVYYAHSVYRGIMSAIRNKNPDLLILGWRGRSRLGYILGSNLDRLVEVPCDVLLVKPGKDEEIKKILFPTSGGPHSLLAADVARIFSIKNNASVTILYVDREGEDRKRIERRLEPIMRLLNGARGHLEIIRAENPKRAILSRCEEYDMVIMGASEGTFLRKALFGEVPVEVGKECRKTVILVKRDMGRRSWIRRWLFG